MKILFIAVILVSSLLSQDMGYKMYKNGDTESAIEYYKQLVDMDDKNLSNEELLYNIGTIYAEIDSTNQANTIFETVYQDSSGYSSELSYNYGNTLYRSQKLEESLKAFRETLLKNPEDIDARKNYEFVKNEIKKNKSMQKEKDKSKESDEEEDEKNKEKEKDQDKKDDNQNDQSNNEEDKNDSKNNDNGPTDNQNSKSPDQQNKQNRDIQSKQSAENILNAIKENEKVNKKRKQANYSNESGKDW
jgi:Ca-activated chloride channel family protein|tara:strand:- start:1723 stop:2460 length:738 start_codon:yes stop_codon:yes gene_type:complete